MYSWNGICGVNGVYIKKEICNRKSTRIPLFAARHPEQLWSRVDPISAYHRAGIGRPTLRSRNFLLTCVFYAKFQRTPTPAAKKRLISPEGDYLAEEPATGFSISCREDPAFPAFFGRGTPEEDVAGRPRRSSASRRTVSLAVPAGTRRCASAITHGSSGQWQTAKKYPCMRPMELEWRLSRGPGAREESRGVAKSTKAEE